MFDELAQIIYDCFDVAVLTYFLNLLFKLI